MSKSINADFADRKQKLSHLKKRRMNDIRKTGVASAEKENRCPTCGKKFEYESLAKNAFVCEYCGHHYRISYRARFALIFDEDSVEKILPDVSPHNPLGFPGYSEKLAQLQEKTRMCDACIVARGRVEGIEAVVAVLDSSFLMGSMGAAVGENIALSTEYAGQHGLPLIIFSASGGARMQEGIFSLMQMAKTAAAIKKFSDKGGLFISYLTNPTTGGVTASFASLGDIMLGEPDALIGFAGPRVIEQTIRAKLPEGFQRAKFQQDHGFLDAVIPRREMKETVARLLRLHGYATGCGMGEQAE